MNNLKSNKGFTFVELIVSIAILSLIAAGIVGIMSSNTIVFRKTKTDLEVQNEAMDTMTMLENDLMQAKYVEIECDDPAGKYICSSDLNLLKYGEANSITTNEAIIDTLIAQTETQTKNIYKGFKNDTAAPSDPSKYDTRGDENRAIYDSFYYKVRYMTKQDKLVYKMFLDKVNYSVNKASLRTYDTLTSSDELRDIKKITIVYPANSTVIDSETITYEAKPVATSTDPTAAPDPAATPTVAPTPLYVTDSYNIDLECCTVTYEVDGNELRVTRSYTTTGAKNIAANTYSDYIDGKLSGFVNGKNNSVSLKLKFMKNNRQYNSDKTIIIRNSNVLNDAK